ncbi:MAG: flagellar hook-associated protein FlgK [Pirellulales bacterium]
MSLFGAIQMGGNTLRAMQIGLQVVGNNIANANTPGYVRQEAIYSPAPVQRQGNLILGLGVRVESIIQKLDRFVQERLVGARSDRAAAQTQERAYRDLEVMLNELSSDGDLSSGMTAFFNSIHEVMTDPGNVAARSQVVGNGVTLTQRLADLNSRVFTIQGQLNERVSAVSDQINNLSEQIRELNLQIVSIEGGDASSSSAGSLRVRRQNAVDSLAELIGIHIEEQPSGALSVAIGGEFLVFEGQRRAVEVDATSENGEGLGIIQFVDSKSVLQTSTGELQGLYTARDQIAGDFLDGLNELAGTLAFEFNKVYSQGQGLVGFSTLTSTETINDADAALDAAGLPFTPVNGAFDVLIHSKEDNLTKTHTIRIDLNGLDDDTTLNDLAAELDAIEGLSAAVTSSGALALSSESTDVEFAFAGDTSGALAALGLNTFFTGSSAGTLGVNANLKGIDNASKFAASREGIGEDSLNAELLAAFLDQPLESAGNASLIDLYNQLLNEVTQGSAAAQSVAEGFRVFEGTLEGQAQAVSGVSLDEEAIKMITLQRIFQASARYIQTISELMDYLVKL